MWHFHHPTPTVYDYPRGLNNSSLLELDCLLNIWQVKLKSPTIHSLYNVIEMWSLSSIWWRLNVTKGVHAVNNSDLHNDWWTFRYLLNSPPPQLTHTHTHCPVRLCIFKITRPNVVHISVIQIIIGSDNGLSLHATKPSSKPISLQRQYSTVIF